MRFWSDDCHQFMYEILCDFNNLYRAYQLAHRGKTNTRSVVEFDQNKLYNIRKLADLMRKKEWAKVFKYYRFLIHEPKERVVDAMTFEGRIVQHVLCDKILRPYFEKRLIDANCACRVGKGTSYALDKVKKAFTRCKSTDYVLKADIRHYFPSIDRSIMKSCLEKFPDAETKELLFWLVDNCPDEFGMPIGNQTSQWFALYYIDKLDRIIKEKFRFKFYIRYMDDFLVIGDKNELSRLLHVLKQVAHNERNLTFNKKTQIAPVRRGVSFLGWRFCMKEHLIIRVAHEKVKYRKQRMRAATTKEQITAYRAFLSFGNTNKFQKKYLRR